MANQSGGRASPSGALPLYRSASREDEEGQLQLADRVRFRAKRRQALRDLFVRLSDGEEQRTELTRRLAVTVDCAAVETTVPGEHERGGIEVHDGSTVSQITRTELHTFRRDIEPGLAAVRPRRTHTDRVRLPHRADVGRRLPQHEDQ